MTVSKGFALGPASRLLVAAGPLDGVLWRCVLCALPGERSESRVAGSAGRRPAIASGLRPVFVGLCVFCVFYSVIAAGVFNYFGRPLGWNLLKLVHGVAAVESSIFDRLTLPVMVALIGVPGGYYALTRYLVRRRKAPVFLVAMLLAWSAFGCWRSSQRPKPYFMPHLSVNPHIELVRSTWNGVTGVGKQLLRDIYPTRIPE